MLVPANETVLYGCASIESPLFSQETNLTDNKACVSLTNEFTIINLYPNPATDMANVLVSTPYNSAITVRIATTSGELVKEITYNDYPQGISIIQIPLHSINSGMYILEINFNGKAERRKLAIN